MAQVVEQLQENDTNLSQLKDYPRPWMSLPIVVYTSLLKQDCPPGSTRGDLDMAALSGTEEYNIHLRPYL